MNVFDTHAKIVDDYASYIQSFINIGDPEIRRTVDAALGEGKLWPEPLHPVPRPVGAVDCFQNGLWKAISFSLTTG